MDIKKLVNREGYRLRVGRWRVIFDVFNEVKIVEIQEVLKRDEHTY
jgi:mRNA interferase RelE/StbE